MPRFVSPDGTVSHTATVMNTNRNAPAVAIGVAPGGGLVAKDTRKTATFVGRSKLSDIAAIDVLADPRIAVLDHLDLVPTRPVLDGSAGPPADPTIPRSEVDVPMRSSKVLSETTLFELPDGGVGYIPTYRLATEVVGGQPRYRAVVRAADPGAELEFILEPIPHPDIDDSADPVALPHILNVALTYQPGGAGIERRLPVELTEIDSLQRGRLVLGSLQEVDEVIGALTERSMKAELQVARTMKSAVQMTRRRSAKGSTGIVVDLNDLRVTRNMPRANGARIDLKGRTAVERRFRIVADHLNSAVPLLFDQDRHDYIFEAVTARPGSGSVGFIQRALAGDTEPYFQDERDRERFYYLPDHYELARSEGAGSPLQLSITTDPADENGEDVIVSFVAVPVVDADRLEAAAVGLSTFSDGMEVMLLPLPFVEWEYFLTLPGQLAQARPRQPGPGSAGFADTIAIPRSQLQGIWDAMAGIGPLSLFGGSIKVELPGSSVTIPFTPRLSDIGGVGLFDAEIVEDGSGSISLTLTNRIESPVRVDELTRCTLIPANGGDPVIASLGGLAAGQVVGPNESLTLNCTLDSPMPGDGELGVLLDMSRVTVIPDLRAIMARAMSSRVVETAFTARFVGLFPSSVADPAHQVVAVFIELSDRAEPVVLRPPPEGPTEVEVRIQRPLAQAILGDPTPKVIDYRWSVQRQGSIDPLVEATTSQSLTGISVPATPPDASPNPPATDPLFDQEDPS